MAEAPVPREGDTSAPGPASGYWDRADSIRPYLKQVARRLMGDGLSAKLDPSDVVQRALLNAHEHAAQFQGRTFPEWLGWLSAVVRNETLHTIQFYRRDVRDTRREEPLDAAQAADRHTLVAPPEQVQRREQAALVMAAMERLPEEYRMILDLRNFQDLPFMAIAEQRGRSVAAVRQLWVRAVRRLRREIGVEA
jgi:RNA polymerase sigma-70 factor, ECF subfamily